MSAPTCAPVLVLHAHTTMSMLDGASPVEDYIAYAKENSHPICSCTDHGWLTGIYDLVTKAGKAKIRPAAGCLFKGQEIVALKGVTSVEQVQIGDLVLTHKGRYRPVTRIMKRVYSGPAYEIKLSGLKQRRLRLTGEHPILVADKDGVTQWTKAENVIGGRVGTRLGIKAWRSYVCLPKLVADAQSINLETYLPGFTYDRAEGGFRRSKRSKHYPNILWKIPQIISVDEDFAYFLGLFCAEGSTRKSQSNEVCFTFNLDEVDFAQWVVDFVSRRFGLRAVNKERPKKNIREVCFGHLPLAILLAAICGSGAKNKKAPTEVMMSPTPVRDRFLNGVLDGDGKDLNNPNNHTRQQTLRTSSKILAWDVRTILADKGFWSSVAESCEGKKIAYCVPYNPERIFCHSLQNQDFLFKPVSEVTRLEIKEEVVYNFEVEEDNSYVSDFILHNCEFYLQPHPDHKFAEKPYDYFHLTVWASNQAGLKNLIELGTKSWEGEQPITRWGKAKPRVTWANLRDHSAGLIVGSGCIEGPIGKCLLHNEMEQAWINARMLKEIFGDRLFFELMPAKVDRDYVKGSSVLVRGQNGIIYRFMPDDILVTDEGEMTAAEALKNKPSEVLFVRPSRIQDGPMGGDVGRTLVSDDISMDDPPPLPAEKYASA